MATSRRFTKGVIRAVEARTPSTLPEFGPLRPGDLFELTGRRTGQFKFLSVTLVDGEPGWINALGPLGERQNLKSIRPEAVALPSTYALTRQRRTRA